MISVRILPKVEQVDWDFDGPLTLLLPPFVSLLPNLVGTTVGTLQYWKHVERHDDAFEFHSRLTAIWLTENGVDFSGTSDGSRNGANSCEVEG
jgi:hypothetical protein